MTDPTRRRRRAGTAIGYGALAALLLGACSSSPDPTTEVAPTAPIVAPATTLVDAPDVAPTATDPTVTVDPDPVDAHPATVAPAVDGAALLAAAAANLATGYHFVTTVVVDGTDTLTAEGDRIGADSRLSLTSNGATVSYIVTADGTFTSTDGSGWEQLDTPPASADPINALQVPSNVTVGAVDAHQTSLSVVVPAAALGVGGGADATLQVVLVDGALTSVDYSAATSTGTTALVHATISAVADPTPITTPATTPANG